MPIKPDLPALSHPQRLWVACLLVALAVSGPAQGANPKGLPDAKQTQSGLYLEAREVPRFVEQQGGATKVLFIDVRTLAEAVFVGMSNSVDALVPFVELQELMTDWDGRRNSYKLEPMQEFVVEIGRRLQQKGLVSPTSINRPRRSRHKPATAEPTGAVA